MEIETLGAPSHRKISLLVIAAGLITTVLTLAGDYLLAEACDFDPMGFYLNFILPAGAIGVGLAASCGYGLASWFTGVKITKALLWTVVTIQVVAYVAAQYISYRLSPAYQIVGPALGFFDYFDAVTRSITFKSQHSTTPSEPLGVFGYGVRALEFAGFVGGSMIYPLILRKAPYCEICQTYKRTKQLGLIPGSVAVRKLKKADTEGKAAYDAEQQAALTEGKQLADSLHTAAAGGDTESFHAIVSAFDGQKKEVGKLPTRIKLTLTSCPRCHEGEVKSTMLRGQGKQLQSVALAGTTVTPEFVRSVKTK